MTMTYGTTLGKYIVFYIQYTSYEKKCCIFLIKKNIKIMQFYYFFDFLFFLLQQNLIF